MKKFFAALLVALMVVCFMTTNIVASATLPNSDPVHDGYIMMKVDPPEVANFSDGTLSVTQTFAAYKDSELIGITFASNIPVTYVYVKGSTGGTEYSGEELSDGTILYAGYRISKKEEQIYYGISHIVYYYKTSTPTPVPTNTPTEAPTETPVPTDTPTAEPTVTPTDIPTDTPVPTDTPTETPISTDTPTPTQEVTDSPAPTNTPEPTETPQPTDTPTVTPTQQDTPTPTQTTNPPEITNTPKPTNTQPPHYSTSTPTQYIVVDTPTPTQTPQPVVETIQPTPTQSITVEETPVIEEPSPEPTPELTVPVIPDMPQSGEGFRGFNELDGYEKFLLLLIAGVLCYVLYRAFRLP